MIRRESPLLLATAKRSHSATLASPLSHAQCSVVPLYSFTTSTVHAAVSNSSMAIPTSPRPLAHAHIRGFYPLLLTTASACRAPSHLSSQRAAFIRPLSHAQCSAVHLHLSTAWTVHAAASNSSMAMATSPSPRQHANRRGMSPLVLITDNVSRAPSHLSSRRATFARCWLWPWRFS